MSTDIKYKRQVELEESARNLAYEKGNSIVQDALNTGRFAELPAGRKLIANAFNQCVVDLEAELERRGTGLFSKYRTLLRRVQSNTLIALGLRIMLCAVSNPEARGRGGAAAPRNRFQQVMSEMGKAIEAEALVSCIEKAAPVYLERTLKYLDGGNTKAIEHRYRTFLAAAEATMVDWEAWTPGERLGTARILCNVLYETGLFEWRAVSGDRDMKHLVASEVLEQHLQDLEDHATPILRHEPMIVPPEPWTAYGSGGYLTPWMRVHTPMVALRRLRADDRAWVLENLKADSPVVRAMNKAQGTPYRVNRACLELLNSAMAIPDGVLGLPPHGETDKPVFPFPDNWDKQAASSEDMETFKLWKRQVSEWYAVNANRRQSKYSIALAVRTLRRFEEEPELYFVSYLDYRGRVYFRGSVHPQSNDAIKGCLELSAGEPLGKEGLFWLKAHVASCAGYDKKDFPLRVQWTDENWPAILAWLNDPLSSPPPEPDTSFTFYAAALALREALALPNPAEYICHIPVAMDATCSGLQHFSALFRDKVGAEYTNLFDSGGDEKRDIYMRVADRASRTVRYDDPVIKDFWSDKQISRSMAKRPVMTFCYGSTLISCVGYVCDGLLADGAKPIRDEAGKTLYSLNKLAVPVAKALRSGVTSTVPAAAAAMHYFQQLAKQAEQPLRWTTPAGMPVLNYVEGEIEKHFAVQSMGITIVLVRQADGKYNRKKAAAAIAPNVVHSLDSSHLCLVLDACPFDIVPIHDSFACLPNRVPAMQRILREQFVELYRHDVLSQFDALPMLQGAEPPEKPAEGTLDIRLVLDSRFIFC